MQTDGYLSHIISLALKVCVFKFESLMPSFGKFYITIVLFCENVTDAIKTPAIQYNS